MLVLIEVNDFSLMEKVRQAAKLGKSALSGSAELLEVLGTPLLLLLWLRHFGKK